MIKILLLILAVLLIAIAFSFIFSFIFRSPPISTAPKTKKAMADAVQKYAKDAEIIMEIGSGWGDFSIYMAKAFPNKEIITYEISPLPYIVSKLNIALSKQSNIKLYYGDAFKALDTGKASADAIFFYLCTDLLKLKRESLAKHGKYLFSHTYKIYGREPIEIIPTHDFVKSNILVYKND